MNKFLLRYLLLFCLIGYSVAAYSQKQANVWYFGEYLGIDFNSGTAVPLNDGVLSTTEGVATISDTSGKLLFYTDGITVWNKSHTKMPNGTGLFGDPSSSQSAIIVPAIGDPTKFYIFTVDAQSGPKGLNYSVVNILLDGGKGDVVSKNISIVKNVTEKITGVRHCNNKDVWVIAHESASDVFFSFLITEMGVNTTPVISKTGIVLPGVVPPSTIDSSSLGYLKASPNGKRIALAHWTVNAEVSDFNNATGKVSNSISLFTPADPHYLSYGVEFSHNSQLLYVTCMYKNPVNSQVRNALFQYDVSLSGANNIRASKQIISQVADPGQMYGGLQLATDGKMYMSRYAYKFISAIEFPDVYGPGCNFITKAVEFSQIRQKATYGLPTFVQSYFYPPANFDFTTECPGLTTKFTYTPAPHIKSVLWQFDDPASGINNESILNNPVHEFSASGTYLVTLINYTDCGSDTVRRQVKTQTLDIDLGKDIVVCDKKPIVLNSIGVGSNNTFTWQDGSSQPTFTASESGLYWVEAKNQFGCIFRDSINVKFNPNTLNFTLGPDKDICAGQSVQFAAPQVSGFEYEWSTGAKTFSIQANAVNLYWCEIKNEGCVFRDTVLIKSILPSPMVNFGADKISCEGTPVKLSAITQGATYIWQDGSFTPEYLVNNTGIYHVEVDLNGCKKSDTVKVVFEYTPKFSLGPNQFVCESSPIKLSPIVDPSWKFLWQDGNTSSQYTVKKAGIYALTATNHCGSSQSKVEFTKTSCMVNIPAAFTPNGDGRNDVFKILGVEVINDFELTIFNRYGQIVYQSIDKYKGWNGKFKGLDSPTGAFVYILKYQNMISKEYSNVKGTFMLLR